MKSFPTQLKKKKKSQNMYKQVLTEDRATARATQEVMKVERATRELDKSRACCNQIINTIIQSNM